MRLVITSVGLRILVEVDRENLSITFYRGDEYVLGDSAALLALFRAQCFQNLCVPVGVCVTTMEHAHATRGLWDQIVL